MGGGSPNPVVDIVVASYPEYPYITDTRERSNTNPFFVSREFLDFARKHIVPLIDQGVEVNILGHSAGTTSIEALRRATAKIYAKRGLSKQEVADKLGSVVAIGYGNVSAAYSLHAEKQRPEFTTVVFNSLNDEFSQERNPRFNELVPDDHVNGELSINRMSKHSLLVTTHTGSSHMWGNPRRVAGHFYDDSGHTSTLFTHRNNVAPAGAVLALERAVRNAVTRVGNIDPLALIETEAREVPEQKRMYSETNRPSRDVLAIARKSPDSWLARQENERNTDVTRQR